MPAPFQNSYDFVNIKRDLSDVFATIVQQRPVFSTLLQGTAMPATSTTHEWLEDVATPKQTTLTAAYTIADGFVTVADTTGFKVGDIIEFELDTGAMSTNIAEVTGVPSGTQLDITPAYGSSTDQNMAINSIVFLQSRPKNEKTLADPDNGYEPTVEYNYTQIFDRTACLSLTNINVDKYGIGDGLNYEVQRQLIDISYDVERAILRGQRVQRSGAVNGTMGGVLFFLEAATGNKVDALGAQLTAKLLNDAFDVGLANGADNMAVLLAHPIQQRVVSTFTDNYKRVNVNGSDQPQFIGGTYVDTFLSDQGQMITVVTSRHMNKDKIALVDPTKIAWVPLQNRQFQDKDATTPGFDGVQRRIIGEYTLQVKNAAESHVLIENLDPTPTL